MSVGYRARILGAVAVLLFALATTSACSRKSEPRPPSAQAVFDGLVARADTAWDSDDAEAAFTLYTEALKTKDATDTAGTVARQQEKAKRLMLSRQILARARPSSADLSSYVQVLLYSAKESTEAAAARAGLADCLEPHPREMRAEVAGLRKRIKAGKSVTMPTEIVVVGTMADGWRKEAAQAPEAVGTHAAAAAKYLGLATQKVNNAFDREYAEDALSDLAAADKALTAADRELAAVRTGK